MNAEKTVKAAVKKPSRRGKNQIECEEAGFLCAIIMVCSSIVKFKTKL
jgi:hypothetical protein